MLIRNATLRQIKNGEVNLAFRRWRRPTVKSGGELHTAIGVLMIESIEKITLPQINVADAKRAGYSSKKELKADLDKRDGQIFKIEIAYVGSDPRIELREQSAMSDSELKELTTRLKRMDARSQNGSWTIRVMSAIQNHPKTLAVDLAAELGFEKQWLKTNVRKLKNLGLTISHPKGYTLSPRGLTVLSYLNSRRSK